MEYVTTDTILNRTHQKVYWCWRLPTVQSNMFSQGSSLLNVAAHPVNIVSTWQLMNAALLLFSFSRRGSIFLPPCLIYCFKIWHHYFRNSKLLQDRQEIIKTGNNLNISKVTFEALAGNSEFHFDPTLLNELWHLGTIWMNILLIEKTKHTIRL